MRAAGVSVATLTQRPASTMRRREMSAINQELFGMNLFGEIVKPKSRGPVKDRFTFPPFSVLDARAGEWQDRKRRWAAMGIQGDRKSVV